MLDRRLRRLEADTTPLTTLSGLDRLLGMMARWWEGWGLSRIAREYGISRQRAATLLAQVGCTRGLWCRADHERPDSTRRAVAPVVAQARAALLHPLAFRLTVRQRAALAWQAQGLVLVDIARRMRTTPQNVRNLQVAGRRRLERLSRAGRRNRARAAARQGGSSTASLDGRVSVDWQELLLPLADSCRPTIGGVSTTPPETTQERERVGHVATFRTGWPHGSPVGRERHAAHEDASRAMTQRDVEDATGEAPCNMSGKEARS